MAKFIRDMAAEHLRTEGVVGSVVEVVVFVPKNTPVVMSGAGLEVESFTRGDLYLIKGGPSRIYATDEKGLPFGEPVAAKISVVLDGMSYVGNDLASESELEL